MATAVVVMPVVATEMLVAVDPVELNIPAGRSKPKVAPSCNTSCSCRQRTSRSFSRPRRLRTYRPRIRSSSNPRT